MSKVAKCGHCRRKIVSRKRRTRASDGSCFVACTCGKQWKAQKFNTGWRTHRVFRAKAEGATP